MGYKYQEKRKEIFLAEPYFLLINYVMHHMKMF